MDRRRLESAHIKYATLQLIAKYPAGIDKFSYGFGVDVNSKLIEITPALFHSFEKKYSGILKALAHTLYPLRGCHVYTFWL